MGDSMRLQYNTTLRQISQNWSRLESERVQIARSQDRVPMVAARVRRYRRIETLDEGEPHILECRVTSTGRDHIGQPVALLNLLLGHHMRRVGRVVLRGEAPLVRDEAPRPGTRQREQEGAPATPTRERMWRRPPGLERVSSHSASGKSKGDEGRRRIVAAWDERWDEGRKGPCCTALCGTNNGWV